VVPTKLEKTAANTAKAQRMTENDYLAADTA
jgi:hypothetical protein